MRVFVTYASRDKPLAVQLAADLSGAGFSVWNPEEDVAPGDNPANVRGKALDDADLLVPLITRGALDESELLRGEIQYALTSERFEGRLIPVLVGFGTFQAGKDVPWILLKLNPVYVSRPYDGFAEVIDRIRTVAEQQINAAH